MQRQDGRHPCNLPTWPFSSVILPESRGHIHDCRLKSYCILQNSALILYRERSYFAERSKEWCALHAITKAFLWLPSQPDGPPLVQTL